MALDPPGAWMARILFLALQSSSELGSTCLTMASVMGRKLTTLTVGDCETRLYRYNPVLNIMEVQYQSPRQMLPIHTAQGIIQGPNQLTFYDRSGDTSEKIDAMVTSSHYTTFPVEHHDILMLFSDGIGDNVSNDVLLSVAFDVTWGITTPQTAVDNLITMACAPNARKPDDVSIYIGLVS